MSDEEGDSGGSGTGSPRPGPGGEPAGTTPPVGGWAAGRADARRWGWPWALYAMGLRALRRRLGVHLFILHARPLGPDGVGPPLPAGVEMRVASRDDLLRAAADPALRLAPASVEAALDRGDLCVAAFERGRLIAYVWRAFGPTPTEDGLWIAFRRPFRYGYKSFTRPEYRGQRIQHPLSVATDRLCLERGYTHGFSYVALDNYPSLASNRRHGNRAIGFAGYVRWFGRCLPFRSLGARRRGIRFYVPTPERPGGAGGRGA